MNKNFKIYFCLELKSNVSQIISCQIQSMSLEERNSFIKILTRYIEYLAKLNDKYYIIIIIIVLMSY